MSVTPEASADKTLDQFISETAQDFSLGREMWRTDGCPPGQVVEYAKRFAKIRNRTEAKLVMAFALIDHWAGVA